MSDESKTHYLYLAEWVKGLRKDRVDEVCTMASAQKVFNGGISVEWIGTLSHGIGMVDHYNPREHWKRTYFIDTQLRPHHLLQKGLKSPDGIDTYLVDASDYRWSRFLSYRTS